MSTSLPKVDLNLIFLLLLSCSKFEAVEFSQFYLPPCCHFAAHPPSAAVVDSSPSEQNGTFAIEPAYPRFSTSGEVVDGEDSNSVYKLIVPLKFPSVKAATAALSPSLDPQQQDEVEAAPPSLIHQLDDESVFVKETTTAPSLTTLASSPSVTRETTTQAQNDGVVSDASSDNVFNVFLYKELEKMRNHRGQHPLPPLNSQHSLPPLNSQHPLPPLNSQHPLPPLNSQHPLPPLNGQHPMPPLNSQHPLSPLNDPVLPTRREETVFDKIAKLGYSMSERLQQLSTTFQSIAAPTPAPSGGIGSLLGKAFQQNSHGPYQMYKTYVKRQAGSSDPSQNPHDQPMKMPAVWIKNLRKALYQSLTSRSNGGKKDPSIQASPNPVDTDSKLLWKNLRGAKLKFIDLTSQLASDLPEEIYLPPGQGPIVSGIATLAGASGNLEIRIPSELYTPTGDNQGAGSGEGTTELCKCSLVNDGDMILAYWSISRIVTEEGQPALQYLVYPHPYPHHTLNLPTPPQLIPFTNGNPEEFRPSQYDPLPNYFNEISKPGNQHKVPIVTDPRHRNPKLYHEPHSHHGHGDYPIKNPHLPAVAPQHPHPPDRGVPISENGKYTDDFLSLYRDAINHHFHNIDSMKSMIEPDENIEGFINQHFPQQPHLPPASLPPPQQQHIPDIPYGGGYLEGPPTSIPGIATPLDPTSNLHDHPKSIQDILSPFVPPPPPPPQLPPPRHNLNPNQRPQFFNGNNGNVDDGFYYEDDRKYQNPNIPPSSYQPNRPISPTGPRKPLNYRPPSPSQNGIPYDDYYNGAPGKPYYTNTQYDKRQPDRDLPKKQAYIKEYFYNNNRPGRRNGNFAQRIGGGGGSLNDIDNPDGYILDFKK